MAKNLVNGTNIVIEESGDNISMNLSPAYNTNLQQEINDSFKENNIYSTTETVVGTWINNEPIYRKVLNFQTTSTIANNNVSISISDLNVDNFVNIYGVSTDKNFLIGSDLQAIGWNSSKSILYVYFNNSSAASYSGYLTIEYIKTTY